MDNKVGNSKIPQYQMTGGLICLLGENLWLCFKVWILQTLNAGIDDSTDDQYFGNDYEPEHHDNDDDRTEKSDVNEIIDIIVEISCKDV